MPPRLRPANSGPPRPARRNVAHTIGRGIQLVAFLTGTTALAMTLSIVGNYGESTAPALGLALLSGAAFTVGWLIQRHFGGPRGDRK